MLKPGERAAVDGVVIDGNTSTDESMATGESIPVEKQTVGPVIASTMNETGSIRSRATSVGADTMLARVARLVETASSRAPAQRIADRAAHYVVIVAVGVVTFLYWFAIAQQLLPFALTLAVTAIVIAWVTNALLRRAAPRLPAEPNPT